MTSNELKDLVREQPFAAMTIHMDDGSSYEVPHPDALLVGNYTAIVNKPNGDAGDKFMYLSIKHITRVERAFSVN